MNEGINETALLLTVDQWRGLIDPEGPWLQRCCGKVSAARDELIKVLLAGSPSDSDAALVHSARFGQVDAGQFEAALARLRVGARLSTASARDIVLSAGHHDVIERAFFPDRQDAGPSWSTKDDSPWPVIASACRDLLGDLSAVAAPGATDDRLQRREGLSGETPPLAPSLREELCALLNRYSVENNSNTPDFILAEYVIDALAAFEKASKARERWYGASPEPRKA